MKRQWAEGGVIVECDRLPEPGVEPAEDRHDDAGGLGRRFSGEPGGRGHTGLALVQHQYGAGALADDQVRAELHALAP